MGCWVEFSLCVSWKAHIFLKILISNTQFGKIWSYVFVSLNPWCIWLMIFLHMEGITHWTHALVLSHLEFVLTMLPQEQASLAPWTAWDTGPRWFQSLRTTSHTPIRLLRSPRLQETKGRYCFHFQAACPLQGWLSSNSQAGQRNIEIHLGWKPALLEGQHYFIQ